MTRSGSVEKTDYPKASGNLTPKHPNHTFFVLFCCRLPRKWGLIDLHRRPISHDRLLQVSPHPLQTPLTRSLQPLLGQVFRRNLLRIQEHGSLGILLREFPLPLLPIRPPLQRLPPRFQSGVLRDPRVAAAPVAHDGAGVRDHVFPAQFRLSGLDGAPTVSLAPRVRPALRIHSFSNRLCLCGNHK